MGLAKHSKCRAVEGWLGSKSLFTLIGRILALPNSTCFSLPNFENRLIMLAKLFFLHTDNEDSPCNHFIMRRHQHGRHIFMENMGFHLCVELSKGDDWVWTEHLLLPSRGNGTSGGDSQTPCIHLGAWHLVLYPGPGTIAQGTGWFPPFVSCALFQWHLGKCLGQQSLRLDLSSDRHHCLSFLPRNDVFWRELYIWSIEALYSPWKQQKTGPEMSKKFKTHQSAGH